MRSELIFSAGLLRIGAEALHKEPIELVFTKQTPVGLGKRESIAESFAGCAGWSH